MIPPASQKSLPAGLGDRVQAAVAALVARPLFWILFVVVPFCWPIYLAARTKPAPPLPLLGQMPGFTIGDQENREFGEQQLVGVVWAANFVIATDDPDSSVGASALSEIQYRARNLGQSFAIVTLGLSERDSPATLLTFAHKHRASPRMWHLLAKAPASLETAAIRAVEARQGGRLSLEDSKKLERGTTLLLVDQRGRIRGTYDGSAETGRDALLHDAGLLVNRGT